VGQRKPVAFDSLFATAPNRGGDLPIVQSELERQTGLTGVISTGDGMDPSHYQNFAITDDAVVFFFGQASCCLGRRATSASVRGPRSRRCKL